MTDRAFCRIPREVTNEHRPRPLVALADNILSGQDPHDVSPKAVALAAMVRDWFEEYDREVAELDEELSES